MTDIIELIDAYAETRHLCGGIYNAKTEAARKAVIEALSGVQALSAAPEAIAKLRHLYQNMVNGAVRDTASAKRIAEGLLAPAIEALERATPPAEQQAQPGAVYAELPEPTTHQIAELKACEHGDAIVGWRVEPSRQSFHASMHPKRTLYTTEQARNFADRTHALRMEQAAPKAAPQQEAQEPVAWEGAEEWEKLAWHLCAEENGEDACNDLIWEGGPMPEPWGDRWLKYEGEARRMIALVRTHVPAPQQEAQEPCPSCRNSDIYACTCPFPTLRNAAPQPAPAPLSDAVEHYLESQDALDNREYAGINAESYETLIRRRNASRKDLDAALAAQGGKA